MNMKFFFFRICRGLQLRWIACPVLLEMLAEGFLDVLLGHQPFFSSGDIVIFSICEFIKSFYSQLLDTGHFSHTALDRKGVLLTPKSMLWPGCHQMWGQLQWPFVILFFFKLCFRFIFWGYDYSACMCVLLRETVSSLNWHHQWL